MGFPPARKMFPFEWRISGTRRGLGDPPHLAKGTRTNDIHQAILMEGHVDPILWFCPFLSLKSQCSQPFCLFFLLWTTSKQGLNLAQLMCLI